MSERWPSLSLHLCSVRGTFQLFGIAPLLIAGDKSHPLSLASWPVISRAARHKRWVIAYPLACWRRYDLKRIRLALVVACGPPAGGAINPARTTLRPCLRRVAVDAGLRLVLVSGNRLPDRRLNAPRI